MTELEKIERAKMYVDKLANGINPLDDSLVPETELINNVRLSRCFFFISDVLRQVISNGGTSVPAKVKRPKKLPLDIPFEKRNDFAYSDTPIPASELAKRVNELIDQDNMQKLTYSDILTWLFEIGMMSGILSPDEKQIKRPTPSGEEIGISVETRTGTKGPYEVVVYNTAAQHFIVDNLDSILETKNLKTALQGAPWTKEHDDCLLDLYGKAVPMNEIANALKRSMSAVRERLKKLGFEPR